MIYPPPCPKRIGKAMKQEKFKRSNLLAALLVLVSLYAIAPALTSALQQNGTISINATGQANPIGNKGSGGPASLSLAGNVQTQGNDPMKFNGLFGTLQVPGATYPVSGGSGEMNNKGTFEIQAVANGNGNGNGKKYELVLHGSMQGNNVVFDCPQSKLASQFFLCLTGQVNITTSSSVVQQFSSSSSSTSSSSTSSESENEGTVTQTLTQIITQNNTQTVTSNQTATTTVFGNQTTTETVTMPQNITTTTTEFNQTITTTVTEPLNQTITATLTTTVANSTITQTTTTTVANVTITETTTTMVANTTITCTNTTALGP